MDNFQLPFCQECGSVRFKTYEDLDPDEKNIVGRIEDGIPNQTINRGRAMYCSKCFRPKEQEEYRA